ncbi:hypothetical protein ZOSMA_115G00110 [Zostera marina]|uniref:Uncharacterized protein n=1 Tax=Zostera marina TaxID=29655 RepID=A0A0K9Q4I5_ZOSMR|nr:hypothetical protein ZOSMA_115G00110 [Zostera marina]
MSEKKEQTLAIGIDLGTTYSCVAWSRHGAYSNIEIIQNEQGSRITPSFVAFTPTDRLVGEGAFNQIIRNPKNTIFDAKSLIGRRFSDRDVQNDIGRWPFQVVSGMNDKPVVVVEHMGKKKQFLAEEISSMVISKMKETTEIYIGRSVSKAVVTVSAYFNDAQRCTTKDACTIAGLTVMRVINEPTVAAIAYGLYLKEREVVGKKTVVLPGFQWCSSCSLHPDEAVACGAAIQAAMLCGSSTDECPILKDFVVKDVTSFSLGIKNSEGVLTVVVPRNTSIPITKKQFYTTRSDYQTGVSFSVYEGERSMVCDNNFLGKFVLDGITPALARIPDLLVTFNIDEDGFLNVTAMDKSSGFQAGMTITNDSNRLNQKEIDKLVVDVMIYKNEGTVPYKNIRN